MRSASLLAVLLYLAASPALSADALDDVLAQLSSKETSTRSTGSSTLRRIIQPAHVGRLVTFYATCSTMACYPVVQAMEQKLAKPTAKAALRKLVESRADYGSVYAAMALHRIGDPWGAERVLRLVDDPKTPEAQRLTYVNYLSSFGDAGRRKLADIAARRTEPANLRAQALDRLSQLTKGPGEEQIVPAYEKAPAETDAKVLTTLRLYKYSRGDLDTGEALDADALAGKLDSTQEYRYAYLVWRLAEAKKVDKQRAKALEYLARKGKSTTVKVYALKALAKIGKLPIAGRIASGYRKLEGAANDYLRREARRIWLEARGSASAQELRREMKQGTLEERVEIAELLLQRDDESGAAVILEALKDDAPVEAKRAATRAAVLLGTRAVLRRLVRLLDDADVTVRRTAYSSCSTLINRLLPYRYLEWEKVGYSGDAEAASRRAAVDKLSAWLDRVLPKKKGEE